MRRHDPSASYRPITATPFVRGAAYTELLPSAALKPYVRCFWGTTEPQAGSADNGRPSLVIPDTCMDVIFTLDHTRNTISGGFCAMDESAYAPRRAPDASLTSTFAIRFYGWTATLFAERPLAGSANRVFDAREFFPTLEKELRAMLMSVDSLRERASASEALLLRHLRPEGMNASFMNAVDDVIGARGTISAAGLAHRQALSLRQLERVFHDHMGISPKSFASLARYQLLWQDLCFSRRPMLDLVEKYGYFDQAHLLNDFKRRHTMTPAQALRLAKG